MANIVQDKNLHLICLVYYTLYKNGNIKLNEEHTEFKWIITDERNNYDLVGGTAEEIQKVDKILKYQNAVK